MLVFNPTKREMLQGLRKRPTYDKVVDTIIKDVPVKLPNRDAKFLRESMAYSQLDNITAFEAMQEQEKNTVRQQLKELIMQQSAIDAPSLGMANLRATAAARPRPSPAFYDVGHDQSHMETNETQIDQGLEYSKSRMQAKKDKMKQKTKTHLINLKTREDELMNKTEQDQQDDLAMAEEEAIPRPTPKKRAKPEKSEPKTPKSEAKSEPKSEVKSEAMKSESDGSPARVKPERKTKVKKEIKEKKPRGKAKTEELKKEEELEKIKVETQVKGETLEERGRKKEKTPKHERSRSRDAKSEAKSEAKTEVKSEPKAKSKAKVERSRSRDKGTPDPVKKELFPEEVKNEEETPKTKKEQRKRKPSKSPPDSVSVKEEIAKIEQQTVTKKEMKALEATVKKVKSEANPEASHEPKGKRGRPKSNPGAAASSSAAAAAEPSPERFNIGEQFDASVNKSHWNSKTKKYIIEQMRVRGFDNASNWKNIQSLNKKDLLIMIDKLVADDKW